MNKTKYSVVGLGELLWDIFPDSRQLGGAPANFAYMTSLLGDEGLIASRVGIDDLGEEAKRRLEHLALVTGYIQKDSVYRTGVAQLEVDAKGQPSFEIAEPAAWDFFDWTSSWQRLAEKADAVCFGSLAQRSAQSRQVIQKFLKTIRQGTVRIFDVNLRQSFYSAPILADSAKSADILKLNHEELPIVAQLLGFPSREEEPAARWLLNTFHAKLVCVTRGAHGSLLMSAQGKHENPGVPVQVEDTVGSGDAFTAALVYHYLRGSSLGKMNQAANRMGAWVASRAGATPGRDETQLSSIRSVRE